MTTRFFHLIYPAFSLALIGCSSSPITPGDDPVQTYRNAKMRSEQNQSVGEYSLEYLKSQAALSLLSQGKTDLKSGNSIDAVKKFSQARTYNPWNDDIKDMYALSVKTLVSVTKNMSSEKCDVINDRLGFIYSIAPDQFTQLSGLTKKCNFNVGSSTTPEFQNLPLSDIGKATEKKGFESLREEINRKVTKNKYVPRKELLYLGLNYLSDVSFQLGKVEIGSEVDDGSKVRVLVPISYSYSGPTRSLEYCEKAKQLMQNVEYENEVGDTPTQRIKAAGYLECSYFNSYGGKKILSFYSSPKWPERLRHIWPLPTDLVVDFIFRYENGRHRSYRNVVSTFIRPHHAETGVGSKFMFTAGDLPFVVKYSKAAGSEKRYVLREESNYLEFEMPSHLVNELQAVEVKINLRDTFKDAFEEKFDVRNKFGPGGIVFDE